MAVIADHLNINVARIHNIQDTVDLPGLARLGFEVELEGGDGDWPEIPGWEIKDDGSLRGHRAEYIFAGPQGGQEAIDSLNEFGVAMAEYGPEPTFRCSTHVHMDMRTADWNVVEKTVLAYMVFEDAFFDHCEAYRRNSNFCIPFMNNDWFSSTFGRRILGQTREGNKFEGAIRWSKYSALNLQVLANFGSIEFRGSHALTSPADLKSLANRMLSLRNIATLNKDLPNMEYVELLRTTNPHDLFYPGSFALDYVMDAGGLAQGVAAAVNAVAQAEFMGDHEAQERAAFEQERARREDVERRDRERRALADVQRVVNSRVAYNRTFLAQVNIAEPLHGNNWRGALNTVMALRGVGLNVVLSDVINSTGVNVRAHVDYFRTNIEIIRRNWIANLDETVLV